MNTDRSPYSSARKGDITREISTQGSTPAPNNGRTKSAMARGRQQTQAAKAEKATP